MLLPSENAVDEYLEMRLQEWAEWLKTGNFLNIGYQRQSSIAMFSQGKSVNQAGKSGKSKMTVDANSQAEEIESMMIQMARYKPVMAECLRNYYLNQLSLRKSAKIFGISHVRYGLYLQMAKQWLIGRLNK